MKKKIVIVMTLLILSVAIAVPTIVSAAGSADTARSGSMMAYFKSVIQGLVDSKKLSQADADAVISDLDAKASTIAASRPVTRNLSMTEIATSIGLTEDQLKEKLAAGSTVWKIAADAGKLDALKTKVAAITVDSAQNLLGGGRGGKGGRGMAGTNGGKMHGDGDAKTSKGAAAATPAA